MPETFRNFIGGDWVSARSGATFDKRNPADTDEIVATFQKSDADDTREAIAAAKAAQPAWAAMPAPKRGEVLYRAANHPRIARRSGGARDDARGREDAARGARRGRPRHQHPALCRRGRSPAGRAACPVGTGPRVHPDPAAAAWRGRADHPVELSDRDPDVEDGTGVDCRERRRAEAVRPGAALRRCAWSRRLPKRVSRAAR